MTAICINCTSIWYSINYCTVCSYVLVFCVTQIHTVHVCVCAYGHKHTLLYYIKKYCLTAPSLSGDVVEEAASVQYIRK